MSGDALGEAACDSTDPEGVSDGVCVLPSLSVPMQDGLGRRARPVVGGQGGFRTLTPSEPQDLEVTGERELTEEMSR